MLFPLLTIAGILIAVFQVYQMTDRFAKTIVVMQVVGKTSAFLPLYFAYPVGHVVYLLALLLVIFYAFRKRDFAIHKKALMVVAPVLLLLQNLEWLLHKGIPVIGGYWMIVPVIAFLIWFFTNRKNIREELGLFVIPTVDSLRQFLMAIF